VHVKLSSFENDDDLNDGEFVSVAEERSLFEFTGKNLKLE
jgi:hypothetical protein